MNIEKIDGSDKMRLPLAQGEIDGRSFVVSLCVDGTGLLFEFHEDEGEYLLSMQDIVVEVLKEVVKI